MQQADSSLQHAAPFAGAAACPYASKQRAATFPVASFLLQTFFPTVHLQRSCLFTARNTASKWKRAQGMLSQTQH
jgi:hypothetical protein